MKKYVFIITVISIIFTGCKKNELKLPTLVNFRMDINRNPDSQNRLIFNEGFIIIEDFSVEGERKEGESISFSKSFPNGLKIIFSPVTDIPELEFDIPQGDYYELVISFSTKYNNGNSNILVKGTYTNYSGDVIPLIFEFRDDDDFSIVGEDDDGNASIILDKNIPVNTLIKFDPTYWFAIVSDNLLNNAQLINIDGQETILVNSDTNEDIYDLVVDRMEETALALW